VTNRIKGWRAGLSELGPESFAVTRRMANDTLDVTLLRSSQAAQGKANLNPTADLNAGIIELNRNGDETNVKLKLIGAGAGGAQVIFESGWL